MPHRPARVSAFYRRSWLPAAAGVLVALYGLGHLTSGLRAAASTLFTFSGTIGSINGGRGDAELLYPTAIAVGPQDRIYVADSGNDRIQIFNADGSPHARFGTPGDDVWPAVDLTVDAPGAFNWPSGIAVDQVGNILVVDHYNHRLQLFGPTGQFIKSFGAYGNFDPLDPGDNTPGPATLAGLNHPTRVALLPGTVLTGPQASGGVALVDSGNHRVIMLDSRLNAVSSFGSHGVDGNGPGELEYPWGIGVDAQFIYVSDPENHRVQIFNHSGLPLSAFGSVVADHSADGLDQPYDFRPDGQGNLIVVDYARSHVLLLTPDPAADQSIPCGDMTMAAAAGRCTIVGTNGLVYDALIIGGFTSSGNEPGQFSFPHAAVLDSAGRLLVVDTGGHRIVTFRASHLTVSPVSVSPDGPVQSGQTVTLSVTVVNDGASGLTVSPVVTANLAGSVVPSTPVFLEAGSDWTFQVAFVTEANGVLSFTVQASGQPAVGRAIGSNAVSAGPMTVNPTHGPKLSLSMTAPSRVGLGNTFEVALTVTNNCASTLSNVTPAVDLAPAFASLTTPPGVATGDLPSLSSRTYLYTYTASAVGSVTFSPSATADYVDLADPDGVGSYQTVGSQTATVRIDSDVEAPKTTVVSVSPAPAATGWYLAPVRVVLAATDNTAVAAINYSVAAQVGFSGQTPGASATIDLTRDGRVDVTFYAEDTARNLEAPQTVRFDIDTTPPTIAVADVAPNTAGWLNQYPTVSFTAGDAGSGLAFVTPQVTVLTDRPGQVVTGIARDVAGNSAQTQVTVNVDTKAPTLVCAPTASPTGLNGWYTKPGPVTVGCLALDQPDLSGLQSLRVICPGNTVNATVAPGAILASASCPPIGAEGVYTVIGEASDVAGNLTATSTSIKIDRTPPVLTCSVSATPIIWPANHKMVAWNPVVTVKDAAFSSATFKLVAAYDDDRDHDNDHDDRDHDGRCDRHGDHHSSDDMSGWTLNTPDTSGMVRAERGQVYTLKYKATDLAGNTALCSIRLTAPGAQGRDTKGDEENHDGKDCDDNGHRHRR